MKQTKIPRIESGSLSVNTRIPKPSGIARAAPANLAISKFAQPQAGGITSKCKTEANPTLVESNAQPRKTILRRFGAANKLPTKTLPRLLNKNQVKSSQLMSSKNDARAINETIEVPRGTALNMTRPVIESDMSCYAAMDNGLIRSNTFVCDGDDDKQVKPSTHDVPSTASSSSSNDTINQANVQLNKERTFKRSLSPIPGEPINSAKRKLMQIPAAGQRVMSASMPTNSTPRRSISCADARNANLTFFGAKSINSNEPQVDRLATFIFDGNTTYEQSKHYAPDASKLGSSALNATMHCNRMFDITQTVQQNMAFYPEKLNATQTLDANNAAELERKNGDAMKSNTTTSNCANESDANLTKNNCKY